MMQPIRPDSNRASEDSGKRITTRACDTCRKKKIRCQLISDVCAQCIKSKSPCHFTPISIQISRRRLTRDRRVEELEKRLAWMESQLRLPMQERRFPEDAETDADPKTRRVSVLNEYQSTYATSDAFGQDLSGSAPPEIGGFTRTPQESDLTTPYQQTRIFQKLPPKAKAQHLVTIYFRGLNTVHPIFDQESFMLKFNTVYGQDCSDSDPGWWAALNVVLALSHQYWDMPDLQPEEDLEAWGYFQNSLDATNQLLTRRYTLESVQALLGMAMIMMAMPQQRPVTLLTSSAIKIAQSLGLHRQFRYSGLSSLENSKLLRVFWVAYSLDKDISLQTRQPPTQSDEDMDVKPPSEIDKRPLQPMEIHHNLFYFRTRLAIIQGQIYRRLLSVKAGKQSTSERAIAAEELEMILQAWRRSIPIELFGNYSGLISNGSVSETSRHPIYLQLQYFKTLAVIHESLPIFPWSREIQSSQVRIHIISAPVTYPAEARSAIKLFNVTPRRKFACVWTALHIFITATTTLLTHTISNPSSPSVQADFQLLEPFLNLLTIATRSSVGDKVEEAYHSSMILYEQARTAVGHSHSGEQKYRHMKKRDPEARESVEDFLERMEHIRSGDNMEMSMMPRNNW